VTIYLLEDSLQIDIYYDCEDEDFEDNICARIIERAPAGEKVLRAGQTHLYLTSEQAKELGHALLAAASRGEG
jgi:adenylate cyclase class IV